MPRNLNFDVDLRRLKIWASANLPLGSHLREVILIEEDSFPAEEFLVKLRIWLKLGDLESEMRLKH